MYALVPEGRPTKRFPPNGSPLSLSDNSIIAVLFSSLCSYYHCYCYYIAVELINCCFDIHSLLILPPPLNYITPPPTHTFTHTQWYVPLSEWYADGNRAEPENESIPCTTQGSSVQRSSYSYPVTLNTRSCIVWLLPSLVLFCSLPWSAPCHHLYSSHHHNRIPSSIPPSTSNKNLQYK